MNLRNKYNIESNQLTKIINVFYRLTLRHIKTVIHPQR